MCELSEAANIIECMNGPFRREYYHGLAVPGASHNRSNILTIPEGADIDKIFFDISDPTVTSNVIENAFGSLKANGKNLRLIELHWSVHSEDDCLPDELEDGMTSIENFTRACSNILCNTPDKNCLKNVDYLHIPGDILARFMYNGYQLIRILPVEFMVIGCLKASIPSVESIFAVLSAVNENRHMKGLVLQDCQNPAADYILQHLIGLRELRKPVEVLVVRGHVTRDGIGNPVFYGGGHDHGHTLQSFGIPFKRGGLLQSTSYIAFEYMDLFPMALDMIGETVKDLQQFSALRFSNCRVRGKKNMIHHMEELTKTIGMGTRILNVNNRHFLLYRWDDRSPFEKTQVYGRLLRELRVIFSFVNHEPVPATRPPGNSDGYHCGHYFPDLHLGSIMSTLRYEASHENILLRGADAFGEHREQTIELGS